MKKASLFLLSIFILQSCAPKIITNVMDDSFVPLESNKDILVVRAHEYLPENSTLIGDIKVGDSGFTSNCGYSRMINEAKGEAQKYGANLLKITKLKHPDFASTCFRIEGKLYRNLNPNIITEIAKKENLRFKSKLPDDANYAKVYFYRPKNFSGSFVGFKVRMDDDTVIGRVRNGEKFEYTITDFGEHEFWGKTESRASIFIDIKKGQEYYIRCGINMGIAVGRPEMMLVDNDTGFSEYQLLEEK